MLTTIGRDRVTNARDAALLAAVRQAYDERTAYPPNALLLRQAPVPGCQLEVRAPATAADAVHTAFVLVLMAGSYHVRTAVPRAWWQQRPRVTLAVARARIEVALWHQRLGPPPARH